MSSQQSSTLSGHTVFITRKLHPVAAETLRAAGHLVREHGEDRPLRPEELRTIASESDGILCLLNDRIDEELLAAAPRCRVYANYAVGYDNMDVLAATRAGVALSNTPDVLTGATAEMAWALLFAVARRVVEGDRLVRQGRFAGWDPSLLPGYEVAGKTLGIIGAGRIGTTMGKRARGFEMRILYTKRSGVNEELEALGGSCVSLEELLRQSDFISVHAPLNAASRHLISDSQLDWMKPTGILINTGRGPVIDEKALVRALQAGKIAGAGLDVYEHEPAIEPGLLELENVVLAPHIGSSTHETRRAMAELAALNIVDVLAGRVPRTCLNPDYVRFGGRGR